MEGGAEPLLITNPSTGEHLVDSASAGVDAVDRVVQAARRAFDPGPWPTMSPGQRSRLVWELGEAIDAADELALLETLNTGKPLGIARAFEISGAAESFRYNAGWATKLNGETRNVSLPGEWHAYTLREAIGVVGLIVPWNSPLARYRCQVAPASAAGCTVVLKPAELSPLTAVRLGELDLEVSFPPGVLNIVQGLGAVTEQRIAGDPFVDRISYADSTAVGKHRLVLCAGNLKRVSLELGGKSPVVIYPNANLGRGGHEHLGKHRTGVCCRFAPLRPRGCGG